MAHIPSPSELQAQRRAALIVQVQCGQITATEAAAQLGISRKTYYEWEKRALSAMVGVAGSAGRPPGDAARPAAGNAPAPSRATPTGEIRAGTDAGDPPSVGRAR